MVNVTINEKQVSVLEGTTILKAAESADIYIPTLCYHPKLSPIGACRVCIVEVDGEDRPVASCETPVRDGMVVRTDTEELARQRKQIVELMLLHHPLDCPVCDKSGECGVQDITVELGIMEQHFSSVKPERPKEELSPVLDLWHTRCIVCGRCVQVCREIQGARAIDYVVRSGFDSKVGPAGYDSFPCESCGQCLSVCPAGVILDKPFLYSARPWELAKVDLVCTFCGLGCSFELGVRDNRVHRVTVRDSQGQNRGNLCSVGRFGRDVVHSEARLMNPAVRKNGSPENVGWDEALDFAAKRLKEISASNDEKSVAGLASARCSNEALFMFQRLMRQGLKTDRIDTAAHLNNLAIIETMTDVYGIPASTASLADIDEADAIVVVDSNIVCTHPVAALEALRIYHSGSAQVLVVGHRSNKLTTQCTQFARTRPGSEAALLNCLANLLIEKGGLNESAIQQRAEGYDALKAHVAKYQLADVSQNIGVDASIISAIAEAIAKAKSPLLIISPGSLYSSINASIARAAVNLAVLKDGKVLSLAREGNAQGALDMGVSPDFLPGYKEANGLSSGSLEVLEILRAVESGDVKALYLMGSDIRREMALLGIPLDIFTNLDLLIVQDVFASPVTELAHVVFPACSFAEREASYTNTYRTLQKTVQALRPLGSCRPDVEIVAGLSQKVGLPKLGSMEAIRAHIASTAPIYDFIKEKTSQGDGGTWDYSKAASGAKPKLSIVEENRELPDDSYPYIVIFDDMLHVGGSTSLHSTGLARIRVDDVIQISKEDAESLGMQDGATVDVKVRNGGSATLPVCISRELPAGVVSIPAHSFEVTRNLISKLDPTALKAESGAPVWFASVKAGKD